TGRFFDTFEQSSWSPGGVSIVQLHTEKEYTDAWGSKPGKPSANDPSVGAVWKVTLYGESQGQILGSHPLVQHMPHEHKYLYPPGLHKIDGIPPSGLTVPDDENHTS